ncbi:formimidoylglutamase [Halostella pelagica]|uniref:formimidoylglutamase n=1 Tax=Halostella pelagica TaxID=2583824 RepID=UPI00108164C9|nr:formimidoylglutamase [Halostella pelagica]
MTALTDPRGWDGWTGTSGDPNDEQFGDVIETVDLAAADRYDAVLVGEPTDSAVIGRKGARQGPTALRDALAGVKTHHFDAGPVAAVADIGDVAGLVDAAGADADAEETTLARQERIAETTARVHAVDALPVFLGGDNSLTYPNAAPLLDEGTLGVVNFDAHLDVREVREDATSGTPYRQLYDQGLDGYACVGARHFETSTAYADSVRERGDEIVTAEEVGDDVVDAVDRALDSLRDASQLYVSVDLDVLDAAAAPGVSAPTPGGLTTRELFRALRLVAEDDRVAGFEVVECAPPLDEGGRTAAAGGRALAHFLAGAGVGR